VHLHCSDTCSNCTSTSIRITSGSGNKSYDSHCGSQTTFTALPSLITFKDQIITITELSKVPLCLSSLPPPVILLITPLTYNEMQLLDDKYLFWLCCFCGVINKPWFTLHGMIGLMDSSATLAVLKLVRLKWDELLNLTRSNGTSIHN
jgi:hypothetical protein